LEFGTFNSSDYNDNQLFLSSNGNVGIGNGNPTVKLDIIGNTKIASKLWVTNEIVVQATYPWSDFVFEPAYQLKTLEQVAQFIAQNNISLLSGFKIENGANFKALLLDLSTCKIRESQINNTQIQNPFLYEQATDTFYKKTQVSKKATAEVNEITGSYKQDTLIQYFKVFPNPSINNFTIECGINEVYDAYLYNVDGKLISINKNIECGNKIDATYMVSGLYLLKIITKNGSNYNLKINISKNE